MTATTTEPAGTSSPPPSGPDLAAVLRWALLLLGALALGFAFLGYCVGFSRQHSARAARRLLLMSVVYLPVVLLLMVADQALFR